MKNVTSMNVVSGCAPSATAISRVQVNPMAATMGQVNELHLLVRLALESDAARTVGTHRVASCRFDGYGPPSKDDFSGMWTKPADYILIHE